MAGSSSMISTEIGISVGLETTAINPLFFLFLSGIHVGRGHLALEAISCHSHVFTLPGVQLCLPIGYNEGELNGFTTYFWESESMRMIISAFTICFCCTALCGSPAQAYESLKLDSKTSKITFTGTKPDGKHDGGFKTFEVTATADVNQPENSKLEIVIDATSLWSDDDKLTNHLKNPDFFDVRKYPKITFVASNITEGDEPDTVIITGKMKMLDKEVEVKIPADVEVTDSTIKLIADFKIDRFKWGMTYGEGRIDKDVSIKAELVMSR